MSSGRSEWLWHSRRQKNRYKRISAIWSVIFGAICAGGLSYWIFARTGEWPDRRLIYVMFGAAAAATILVQAVRVMRSVIRDSNGDIRPMHVWFGSFETNALLPLVVPPLFAAFSYWFVGPLLK